MSGGYSKMAGSSGRMSAVRERFTVRLFISYAIDWILVLVFGFTAMGLNYVTPNKRPFSLTDPNISFPYQETESCPIWMLVIIIGIAPVIIIILVCLILIPGGTVPANTPKALIWKRKLWELHVGLLGLGLSLVVAFFFTQGTKNWFGKPRPDLLDRCQPDIDNAADYAVGGFSREAATGRLYSASICQQTDSHILEDGFRSYPSGHSSTSAAGLVYLSLFLASKLAVNIPFVASGDTVTNSLTAAAFPSRTSRKTDDSLASSQDQEAQWSHREATPSPTAAKVSFSNAQQNQRLGAIRRQAAAPPIYLLVVVFTPFAASIWIAASRWYDFRHHGFDILFGYLMGLATSYFSFRLYHMPMRDGAGWAWGARSNARAFWAGVGRLGYAGDRRNIGGLSSLSDLSNKRYDGASAAGPAQDYRPTGVGALNHPSNDGSTQQSGISRNDQPHAYDGSEDYGVARPYGHDEYDNVNMQRHGQSGVELQPMQNRF